MYTEPVTGGQWLVARTGDIVSINPTVILAGLIPFIAILVTAVLMGLRQL